MKLLSLAKYVALTGVFFAAACQTSLLSDSRLADNTAEALNVAPTSVSISNRHTYGAKILYNALVGGRTYTCETAGGTTASLGIIVPPECRRL
jgi:hypothetical protein